MVIRCTHCKGLMKLDETRIPEGGAVRVRCPRCQGLGFVRHPSAQAGSSDTSTPAVQSHDNGRPHLPASSGQDYPGRSAGRAGRDEPAIPEDAFQGFRFPSEAVERQPARPRLSPAKRALLWGAISLAVVAVLALLVNIVLPGPAGRQPFAGAVQSVENDRPHSGGRSPVVTPGTK